MIFDSASDGIIEWHNVKRRTVMTAPLKVRWKTDSIMILQLEEAVSSDGEKMQKYDYTCKPNRQRLLEAVAMNGRTSQGIPFMLEKVY